MPGVTLLLIVGVICGAVGWLLGRRAVLAAKTDPQTLSPVPLPRAGQQVPGILSLFDIDDLRGVNAQAGLDTGDRLLHAVGDTLRRGLPADAGIERLESGRFLVWMPGLDLDRATDRVETMRAAASRTLIDTPDGQVSRGLSVGVVATASNESRARTILRADAALAKAKQDGGDRTRALAARPVVSLAPPPVEVEEAIATRALEYYVQPIVDLDTRKPTGVEGLLRWVRTDGTVLGPDGFMDTLTRIPEAGADLFPAMAIEAATPFVTGPRPIYATFNVTGALLDGENSVTARWLYKVLDSLPPDNLVMELVERAVIVDPARSLRMLTGLKDRGLRIALDDFGTGLSNFDRLRDLPVDILKIDRMFVQDLGTEARADAIIANLVGLADTMGLDMIAEGIETEAQARQLRALGVRYGQGYHFGRPAPARDWAERFAQSA